MRRLIPVDPAAVPRIPRIDGAAALDETRPDAAADAAPTAQASDSPAPEGLEAVSARAWRALAIASLGTVLVGFNSTATNIAIDAINDPILGT